MAMRPSTRMQLARMAREDSREQRLPGRKMEIEYERWDEPRQDYGGEMRMGGYGPYSRGNSGGSRSGGGRMEYGGAQSNWREPESRNRRSPRMGYDEPESRFRDRRGREHYDNGRFAPMRSEYQRPFGDETGGEGMRPIGFNADWGGEMRMGGSDASVPRYNEFERMPGNRATMGGYMGGHGEYPKMDERTAKEWVMSMENEDGTKSPHWTMEQVKQVAKQKGLRDIEVPELFAVLNALYSDYDPIFKKHGVSKMDFYVDMAEAWIMDKDAVENKASAYYECIAKR